MRTIAIKYLIKRRGEKWYSAVLWTRLLGYYYMQYIPYHNVIYIDSICLGRVEDSFARCFYFAVIGISVYLANVMRRGAIVLSRANYVCRVEFLVMECFFIICRMP